MRQLLLAGLLLILLSSPVAHAENWPQWRGPMMNGVSSEKNVPLRWTTAENIVWKLALPGLSGSTPIIWRDRIFLNVADGDDLYLWCVDRTRGAVVWKKLLGSGNVKMRKQNMSSPSPVTDGRSVYVMTGTGILKGFDFNGKELWSRDIQREYGTFGLNWGYASSPLLAEDALYVQVLHGMKTDDPSYVLRLNKTTGKTIWKVDRPTNAISESPDSYTTPALLRYGKNVELVITGGDVVTGHDPVTGKELWRANGLNPDNNPYYRIVASPVIFNEIIYAPTRVKPAGIESRRARGRNEFASPVVNQQRPRRSHAGYGWQVFLRRER